MNFINDLDSTQERIELKYCERCGGLFFRAHDTGLVYCASCSVRRTDWDTPVLFSKRLGGRPGRKPRITVLRGAAAEGGGQIGVLQGIAVGEVHPC
jgi:hypothetical protein